MASLAAVQKVSVMALVLALKTAAQLVVSMVAPWVYLLVVGMVVVKAEMLAVMKAGR